MTACPHIFIRAPPSSKAPLAKAPASKATGKKKGAKRKAAGPGRTLNDDGPMFASEEDISVKIASAGLAAAPGSNYFCAHGIAMRGALAAPQNAF